jgi:hypothetical protein
VVRPARRPRRGADPPLKSEELDDRERVSEIVELVLFALMVSHASGRRTPEELGATLERVARTVLAPASG